jgi:chromosome segregation ATPase
MSDLNTHSTKVELAIERLTEISSDLNKMLAVHEQRINQHEKQMDNFGETLEKRREDSDLKLKEVYETIRSEDKNIIEEINKLRNESLSQHEKLTERIQELEQKIWMYVGGFAVVVFLVTYGQAILKFFAK